MKTAAKLSPKSIKLDAKEKYTRLFSTKNGNALSLRSGHVLLKENGSIGEHNTGDSEEILIVLEGNGVLRIKGRGDIKMERNTALYVPPNTIHDVKNTGREILKYVYVTCHTETSTYESY